jgi:hypothetical protein
MADEAHDERFRQHEAILEGLAKVWTRQGEIIEELRAFNQQQGEINQDGKTTLAAIETLRKRVRRPDADNGREA